MNRTAGFGILVVLCGVLYLLVQAGVLSIAGFHLNFDTLWPLLLVLAGLSDLGRTFAKRGRVQLNGLYLTLLGILLFVHNVWPTLFPASLTSWTLFVALSLVFIGIYFMLPKSRRRKQKWEMSVSLGDDPSQAQYIDIEDENSPFGAKARDKEPRAKRATKTGLWHLIGDTSVGRQPWTLKDTHTFNGIGDTRINLATAHVEPGSYQLDIQGWIGDIRVLVPKNLPVAVEAEVSVGDLTVFGENQSGTGRSFHYVDPAFATADRRCHIFIKLKIGDVDVRRV